MEEEENKIRFILSDGQIRLENSCQPQKFIPPGSDFRPCSSMRRRSVNTGDKNSA